VKKKGKIREEVKRNAQRAKLSIEGDFCRRGENKRRERLHAEEEKGTQQQKKRGRGR